MTWGEIADKVFAWLILFGLIMFVLSVIGDAITSQWRAQMIAWQEGRIRDLEWENHNLRSDLRWIDIDKGYYRRRAESAEERSTQLYAEISAIYRSMAERESGNSGAPASQVAA